MAHTHTRETLRGALARVERVLYITSREPSDEPQNRNYLAFAPEGITSPTSYSLSLLGFLTFPIGAANAALGVVRFNQRGSETSQTFYGHLRYHSIDLNLLRLFCPSFLYLFSDSCSSSLTHTAINLLIDYHLERRRNSDFPCIRYCCATIILLYNTFGGDKQKQQYRTNSKQPMVSCLE